MSKYKAGDKIVLEILQENYGDYKVGNETDAWWISSNHIDATAKPLSEYTDPLNDKIKRQAAEITRLLKDNAELKKGREAIRDNAFEAGLIRGQEEAWELARKIACSPGYSISELIEIFGNKGISWCISCNTYSEAAAKVAEWERKKEEICVGDVLLSKGTGDKCVVTYIGHETVTILWDDGSCVGKDKNIIREEFEKIGHIDIASMLAQIGGGSDE